MSVFLFHTSSPKNEKEYYSNESVDFQINEPNRKIVLNSIRFAGELEVFKDSSNVASHVEPFVDDIFMNNNLGAHSLINSIKTTFSTRGDIEDLQDYARFHNMVNVCTENNDDLFNLSKQIELKTPLIQTTQSLMVGEDGVNKTHFSFKPSFCLNQVMVKGGKQAPYLRYTQAGTISVRVNLAKPVNVFYGSDMETNTNLTYQVKKLRIMYKTVEDDGQNQNLEMITRYGVKPTLNSNNLNYSIKVPAVCSGVSISAIPMDLLFDRTSDTNRLYQIPNVKELEFLFNDSNFNNITYAMTDLYEMIQRGLESMNSVDTNSDLNNVEGNQGFIIGLNFNEYVDLSNQKFNINLESDLSNNNPYQLFIYFHSVINM